MLFGFCGLRTYCGFSEAPTRGAFVRSPTRGDPTEDLRVSLVGEGLVPSRTDAGLVPAFEKEQQCLFIRRNTKPRLALQSTRNSQCHHAKFKNPSLLIRKSSMIFGRNTELAALNNAYEQMLAGAGNVVFLTGEAGLGKTTLVREWYLGIKGQGPEAEKKPDPPAPDP